MIKISGQFADIKFSPRHYPNKLNKWRNQHTNRGTTSVLCCAADDADTDWIYDDTIEKNNSAVPTTYQYRILQVVLNRTLTLAQFSR